MSVSKSSSGPLSPDEVARYHADGYVIPDFRLPDDAVEALRVAYDRLLADNPGLASDIMLGPHLKRPGAQGVKGNRIWFEFATRPEVLDIAAQLIGPDIVLWGTTIFGKPARGGKATPWHQDGDYYPITPLETCSVWIAIDDAAVDNGCMKFLPGSHKAKRVFPHHWEENDDLTINQVCDAAYVNESSARDIELRAGQMSFHDVHLVHASNANTTGRRRAAFVIRLMPAHCHYDHDLGRDLADPHPDQDYGNRALFLVRGEDKSGGRNDFTKGR